jgi:hypothetical protein
MFVKRALKLEEFIMGIFGILGFIYFDGTLLLFLLGILLPDLGVLGYLINPTVGSYTYNLTHHKGLAIVLFLSGYFLKLNPLIFIGITIFIHSSFDRALGYGLKYKSSFKNTHLGFLNRKRT